MSILDALFGQQAQVPGATQQPNGLQQLFSPEVAMPVAAALLGNQGNAANFGNALGAYGQVKAQTAQKNKTMDFFRQQAPEYAQAVEAGMPLDEAWKSYTQQKFAQKGSTLINAGNGQIYDPANKSWITAPGGESKPPHVEELFDPASGQPYKAVWNEKTGTYERVGGVKARSGMQLTTNADGTVSLTEGPLSNLPKLSEAEAKNAGFLERGNKSNAVLNELEGQGTSLYNSTIGNIPIVGNYARSQDAQKYDQAKRDFVNAVLRRESGAVISPNEFANAEQQYFPQPGDGPEVIAQKRANREAAIKGFQIGSGQGAGLVSPTGVDYKSKYGLD